MYRDFYVLGIPSSNPRKTDPHHSMNAYPETPSAPRTPQDCSSAM